jgi:hypothetical protein
MIEFQSELKGNADIQPTDDGHTVETNLHTINKRKQKRDSERRTTTALLGKVFSLSPLFVFVCSMSSLKKKNQVPVM